MFAGKYLMKLLHNRLCLPLCMCETAFLPCSRASDAENDVITAPQLSSTRISSFRCSWDKVLALTDANEALQWGDGDDGFKVFKPELVEGFSFPREVFSTGLMHDSGGAVYLGRSTPLDQIPSQSVHGTYLSKSRPDYGTVRICHVASL